MSDPNLPYGLPWYCEDSSEEERIDDELELESQLATERPSDSEYSESDK